MAAATNFQKANCIKASFNWTNLTNANFWHSNLKRTIFLPRTNMIGANFSDANLCETVFIFPTTISKEQLESALSFRDAKGVYPKNARHKNFINSGNSNCNISQASGWMLKNSSVNAVQFNSTAGHCNFTLTSLSTEATIYQCINLSNKWDSSFWPYSQAVLKANLPSGVLMELKGIDGAEQVLAWKTLSRFHYSCSN